MEDTSQECNFDRKEGILVSKRRIICSQDILQLMNKSDVELNNLSDDDYDVEKTYKPRSDEIDEEKHGNICNGKKILDHPLPSNSIEPIHFIVLAVTNS
ncbi:hypothetical protein TNCV_2094821 [Trichonephila clavipes]|nr:hypothetical protein TNCV_2094821 [Trichonephila clavipes]